MWTQVGVVAGSILAVLTLLALVTRGLRRAGKGMAATWRKMDRLADDLAGDRHKGIPSVVERIAAVDGKLSEHISWHNPPARNGLPNRVDHS